MGKSQEKSQKGQSFIPAGKTLLRVSWKKKGIKGRGKLGKETSYLRGR